MTTSLTLFRIILVSGLLGMLLLSAFYLRGRKLTFGEYLGWGMLALLVPLLGPFLAIFSRPGQTKS